MTKDKSDLQKGEVIRVLHLSDFHFREKDQWNAERVLIKMSGAISDFVNGGLKPDLVVLSGDLAHSGKRQEYKLASQWIDEYLMKALHGFQKSNLFIVPGNHDVDRDKIPLTLVNLEKDARKKGRDAIAELLKGKKKKALLKRHSEYLKFVNQHRNGDSELAEIWWAEKRTFGSIVLGIAGLASSLASSGDEDRNNLFVSLFQLNEVFKHLENANVNICLVAIHHPFDYLCEEDKEDVEQRIRQNCSILLRGHLHQKKSVEHRDPDYSYLELAAGSAYAGTKFPNAFQLIELDVPKRKIRVNYRRWEGDEWIIDRNAYKANAKGIATFSLRVSGLPKKERTKPNPQLGKTLIWSRTLLEVPLKAGLLRELRELLSAIRTYTYDYLYGFEARLKDEQIRANIFIADYRQASDGVGYILYMPDELRIKMTHPAEWHMKFRPGQGATGMVFTDGQQRFSRRLSKEAGEWETILPLTKEQKDAAHKDLEWILSLPLKDPATRETMAVLNIDGLDHPFNDELLSSVAVRSIADIYAIEILLAEQAKVRLNLTSRPHAK